jgi:hypothetical protein
MSDSIPILSPAATDSRSHSFPYNPFWQPRVAKPAVAAVVDAKSIMTRIATVPDVRTLASGVIVGDLQGGLSFPDDLAAALEARSRSGWMEAATETGDVWTVIVLDR